MEQLGAEAMTKSTLEALVESARASRPPSAGPEAVRKALDLKLAAGAAGTIASALLVKTVIGSAAIVGLIATTYLLWPATELAVAPVPPAEAVMEEPADPLAAAPPALAEAEAEP